MTGNPARPQSRDGSQTMRPSSTARAVAFDVLVARRQTGRFAKELLDEQLSQVTLAPAERRLATEIVFGVIRRQATLDVLLTPHLHRPRQSIEEGLGVLLQIGAYQIACLTSVPAHAAVHETVQVAKLTAHARWVGILNAVLRALARSVHTTVVDQPGETALPIAHNRYLECDLGLFPDPAQDPRGYFAKAFSFPDWLVERWLARMSFDDLLRLGFWFNAPASLVLRANALKTSRDALIALLAKGNVASQSGNLPEAVHLDESAHVPSLPGFTQGWFSVQDSTAMSVARLLAPQPGEHVLDMCAAPGTKTTHLAELMNNSGRVIAADVESARLPLIHDNTARLGITIVETCLVDREAATRDYPAGPFDAVLVDAPCTNTGVLGKRPEARWRVKPSDVTELAGIQLGLLNAGCDRLKPGGRIVYSTCSIEPEENRQVVDALLASRTDMELVLDRDQLPGQPGDGGYQALLRRKHGA